MLLLFWILNEDKQHAVLQLTMSFQLQAVDRIIECE